MADEIRRLLPRIPDEVTLDLIVPNCIGETVSGWRQFVRGGGGGGGGCYEVPPFPYVDGGVPPAFQCVAVDGKSYILGGEFLPGAPGGDGVYMLDLVNGMQWKRCASMIEPRVHFGCGVFGGKIYVFGGLGIKRPLCGSEVFDPKEDTWSPIKGMPHFRFNHQVVTVGNELIVHRGRTVEQTSVRWDYWERYYSERPWRASLYRINHPASSVFDDPHEVLSARLALDFVLETAKEAIFLEFYNPVKDEWRVVEAIPRQTDQDVWNVVEAIPTQGRSFLSQQKESFI